MRTGKKKKAAALAVLFILLWMSAGQDMKTAHTPLKTALAQSLADQFAQSVCGRFLPIAEQLCGAAGEKWFLAGRVEGMIPLYGMARRKLAAEENASGLQDAPQNESSPAVLGYEEIESLGRLVREETEEEEEKEENIQALLQEENEAAADAAKIFSPHGKRMQVDLEELRDYDTLVRTFYTIDANTSAGSDQLNLDSLIGRDMTVSKKGDEPRILIYHTHSQEGFADSVPGDESTTIVGVGECLAEALRAYGYNVLHHTGQYDVETRDEAYGRALPELERILAANPSIEVMIDLHRDQVPEDTRLALELDGRPTARFMFFNGLSRTRKTGDIAYLRNDNIADNLALSFQMQLKAQEYYPGLTRKIYLKGYRYNMHLRPKSMLIELGAQNNTVEEAVNACDPLAHLLHMVLSGEE